MSEAVRVDVGECRCPASPHDSDWVDLEPELTLAVASGAMFSIQTETDGTNATLMRLMTESYLPGSIRAWVFTDEKGETIPVNRPNMERLIPFDRGGMEVSEQADALYAERLMAPLLRRLSTSAKRGRTAKRTSPIPITGRARQKSSGPSSPEDSVGRQSAASGR